MVGRSSRARRARGAAAWLTGAGALAFVLAAVGGRSIWVDTSFDLYAGRYVVHHGVPDANTLTLTAHGAPWTDQQWLAHAATYLTWSFGGYPALAVLGGLAVATAFALLAALLVRHGMSAAGAFCWTAVTLLPFAPHTALRAQVFAYPLFVALLWLLSRDAPHRGFRWSALWPVPLLVLWSNVHGSVLLGVAVVVAYAGARAVGAARRRDGPSVTGYGALALLAAGSVLCTPYGLGIVRYYRSLTGNPVVARYVDEWQPTHLGGPGTGLFLAFAGLVVVAVTLGLRRGSRPGSSSAALAVTLFAAAVAAARFQTWFLLGGGLVVAEAVRDGRRRPALDRVGAVVAGLVGLSAAAAVGGLLVMSPASFDRGAPVAAARFAATYATAHPGAAILADEPASGELLWRYPQTAGRVGFDIRYEQYSEGELRSYFRFLGAEDRGWQALAAGYDVVVASRPVHPALAAALPRLAGWHVVYAGADGVVVVKVRRP